MIQKGKSDINPYAAKNEAEFLAVASEYFFKQPELMQHKHPQLFDLLSKYSVNRKKLDRQLKIPPKRKNNAFHC